MLLRQKQVLTPAPLEFNSLLAGSNASPAYLPLIERMRSLRESRPDPVTLAFAAVDQGAGTSYVVDRLSTELRAHTGDRVTTCSAADLREAYQSRQRPFVLEGALSDSDGDGDSSAMEPLRKNCDYIIVDCPPLRRAPDAMLLARNMDGICLVIEAGKTTRADVQAQLTMISLSGIRIFGLVLNKRRYPVPAFIYRML